MAQGERIIRTNPRNRSDQTGRRKTTVLKAPLAMYNSQGEKIVTLFCKT
ncbi:hypothetical protein SeKA_B0052 (plasmid) [Salmonella enterica subsp. enterica serovar Kentucky str. CVM29188]|nr:hypothetical protein SeKA_B0052 [Salmonella enterica subsp. enterica serovar Kentucky str. CVM29188]